MLLKISLEVSGLWLAGLNVTLVYVPWPLNGRLRGKKRAQRRWQLLPGVAADWKTKESCMIHKEMTWWPGELGCLLDTLDPTQTSSFQFHLQSNRMRLNLQRAHQWKIRGQKIILWPVSCDFVSLFWALICALNMLLMYYGTSVPLTHYGLQKQQSVKDWVSLPRICLSFCAWMQVWKE